jgi:hypothetical protein
MIQGMRRFLIEVEEGLIRASWQEIAVGIRL